MKDYSDYLICSDYDGTLDYGGICEKNIQAINYFTSHGGKFTLCTGRNGESFYSDKKIEFEINAPIIGLTGSQIYDGKTKTVIEQYCMDDNWADIVSEIIGNLEYEQTIELVGVNDCCLIKTSDKDECLRMLSKCSQEKLYKITGYTDYKGGAPLDPMLEAICLNRCNVTSNGYGTYEITRLGVNKGFSAVRVKELVGAKKLICVGDFIGDISMLKNADVSYAVGNAIDEVKAVADRVTVHAAEGAISAIIADIKDGKAV